MSSETHGGGRYEPQHQSISGPGMQSNARCDECGKDGHAGRRKARVKAGPLRGISGMVCVRCLDKRKAAA